MRPGLPMLLLGLVLAGCSAAEQAEDAEEPVEAIVNIDLRYPLQTLCEGALEYRGIGKGASVTFRSKSGDIIGTAELPDASEDSTAMNCYWRVETELSEPSDFVTAEIAGWTSEPEKADARSRFVFNLETSEQQDGGGAKARVDPGWSKG